MNVSCVHGIVYYDVQRKVDVLPFTDVCGKLFFESF